MKRELIAKHEKDSRACRDAFALTLKDMICLLYTSPSPRDCS